MKVPSYIFSFLIGAFVGLLIGLPMKGCSRSDKPAVDPPCVLRDTFFIHDTTELSKVKLRYITKHDTAIVFEHDSIHDTIYVEVPISHNEYTNTFGNDSAKVNLSVLYSGYRASIDSIGIGYEFNYTPRTITKKKGWGQFVGFGVGAGYGVSAIGNQAYLSPQVGITIVYGFGYHW